MKKVKPIFRITAILLGIFLIVSCASAPSTAAPRTAGPPSASPTASRPTAGLPSAPATQNPDVPETPGETAPANERVLLIRYSPQGRHLVEYDLSSGEAQTLFQAPEESWLMEAVRSPDGSEIVLAYAPPPGEGQLQYGFTDLYRMPADGSGEPQVFLQRQRDEEAFFHPVWAPDGSSIFYSHFFSPDPDQEVPEYLYTVEKASLDGSSQIVLREAFWPAISPDGSQLAYLTAYPDSFTNELYLANIDGSQPRPAFSQPAELSVDEHFFTQDGSALLFSMVNPSATPASSFWDRLFGVQIARAHDVPSDWYRASVAGGQAERLTQLNERGLIGDLSPDGRELVFISSSGLYRLMLDSGQPELITEDLYVGSVDWIR